MIRKIPMPIFCKNCLLLLSFGWISTVNAQKVPNIQERSQWLPSTSKIDGKLSEWNDLLKAYNKATLIEYTIANDDKNLYLAIRSKDKTTTAKILAGGIDFILNTSATNASTITFPLTPPTWIYSVKTGFAEKNYKVLSDSISIQNDIAEMKEIKVLKLAGVSDSILSIYNKYGVKSKLTYSNGALICELLIPLDRFELPKQKTGQFTYKVRVNGVPVPARPAGIPIPTTFAPPMIIPPNSGVQELEMRYVTDFEGKYTLVKK